MDDNFRLLKRFSIILIILYLLYAMVVIYRGTKKADVGRVAAPQEKAWMRHHGIDSAPVDDNGTYFIRKGKRINL